MKFGNLEKANKQFVKFRMQIEIGMHEDKMEE